MNLRRRRPVSETDQVEVVDVAEPVETVETVETVEFDESDESDESVTVRALRAQVRSLEQALEVAPDRPVARRPVVPQPGAARRASSRLAHR